MKIHLKFDHDAKHTLDALDCPFSVEEVNEQFDDILYRFIQDENLKNMSHLSELLHKEIDYSAILYMATKYATLQVEKITIKKMLKDFLDNDEYI